MIDEVDLDAEELHYNVTISKATRNAYSRLLQEGAIAELFDDHELLMHEEEVEANG